MRAGHAREERARDEHAREPPARELSPAQRSEVTQFGEEFKAFLGRAKTETAYVREAVAWAEGQGFRRTRAVEGSATLQVSV